ncbi:MAG: hypothetical protein BGO89_11625 [Candidatus Kapaibacterium thiocyanatum]|uniref:DUF1207 domain-containing protein n=1 Tax=Candidatus Kapaibacterium thiocyanatum TaxID=1895771 RepID=A0A1M3KY10_9BACT|nr:MAG: hypothetical protein BGO89_11625 ['Candidatus Kapabacteria' thiocyanatum]
MTIPAVSAVDDGPFAAPVANPLEGRIGTMVQFGVKHLRLDIGATVDVMNPLDDTASGRLRIGADFFTFTRLRSEGNFKFPVETSDYFFGLNATYALPSSPLHARLRIAHISSHLVDGYADGEGVFTRQAPFVYSREFVELIAGYHIGSIRPYAGFTWLFATQPKRADRVIPQAGVDVRQHIGGPFHLRGGFDWKLVGIDGTYATAQAAQLGVFFDGWNGRGLMLSIYGYNGRSMHGMFFDQNDRYLGLGFQVVW